MEISSGQPIYLGGNGCGNGFCGDEGLLVLAFLAMMGGGFGPNCGRNGNVPNNIATTDTVNQAVQFSQLQNENQNIMAEIQRSQNAALMFGADKYSELQRDISNNAMTLAAVQAQQAECCCQIKQEIAALNLENEKRFAALNSKLDQQEIQRLRDEVNNLKSDVRMQNVVRYPNGFTYNAGNNPFCVCGNGNGCAGSLAFLG